MRAAFMIALGLALSGNLRTPSFAQGIPVSTVSTREVMESCRQGGRPPTADRLLRIYFGRL
jgi:hypothetical protein